MAAKKQVFLTECNIVDQFKPPSQSGLKVFKLPKKGQKELLFPEVRPRKYHAYTPGARIFGFKSYGYKGKYPGQFAHLGSSRANLLSHELHADYGYGFAADEDEDFDFEEALKQATTVKSEDDVAQHKVGSTAKVNAVVDVLGSNNSNNNSSVNRRNKLAARVGGGGGDDGRRPQTPGNRSECSSCSLSASCCSTCCSNSTCSCIVASGPKKGSSKKENYDLETPSSSASLYEGLDSISQVPSKHSAHSNKSARSLCSSTSTALMLGKLQNDLAEERKQRANTENQLIILQQRQDALMQRINGIKTPSSSSVASSTHN